VNKKPPWGGFFFIAGRSPVRYERQHQLGGSRYL